MMDFTMDLLDRLLGHDAWTTRLLLERCQELTDEQLDAPFDIGHRSVRATLLHVIRNVEVWADLLNGEPVRSHSDDGSVAAMMGRLNLAAGDLARAARAVNTRNGWDERFVDTLDDPPAEKSYGGAIAHAITHSMHHRAQVLYMMRQLGLKNLPEGDVLSWEQKNGRGSAEAWGTK
jgi:uncharacterized damage-inducible protein DinB